jgi:metacaspase-1
MQLHRHLVSALPPRSTLFCIFDCCHSGSAIELPFLYRTDDEGNLSMLDNFKEAGKLLNQGMALARGGFSMSKLGEAKDLYEGASSFFGSFGKDDGDGEPGLEHQDDFGQDWASENKFVTMFSGCRDDQTSADANIGGEAQGALSWAILDTMNEDPEITYIDVSSFRCYPGDTALTARKDAHQDTSKAEEIQIYPSPSAFCGI